MRRSGRRGEGSIPSYLICENAKRDYINFSSKSSDFSLTSLSHNLKIRNMDEHQELWNRLNQKLANLCADGEIDESEMENILDECQLMDLHQLKMYCEQHNF